MLSEKDLKTLIPAFVAPCVLLYEAITGNKVSDSTSTALTNGILIGVGFIVSMWGAYQNHQKKTSANVITPPKIPPDTTQTVVTGVQNKPIVTQEDLNKQIGG